LLKPYNDKAETLLARDSDEFCQQLVHHRCTALTLTDDQIKIDFSETDKLESLIGQRELILKVESKVELLFEPVNVLLKSEFLNRSAGKRLYTLRLMRVANKKLAKLKYMVKS
jgi:hypothetical protein